MYKQAEELQEGHVVSGFDICIVGAGAAGIAIARRLIGCNKKILLLASGQPSDRGIPDARRQAIYEGTVGSFLDKTDPIFMERSRLHMYGGTTNHFGFWARPLDPWDFRAIPGCREAHWPYGLEELVPYYQDAHEFGHFGPFNYDDLNFWERVLYARCFPSEKNDSLEPAIMHAQYEEELHDFQLQFGAELELAENISVLFNAHLLEVESNDANNEVIRLHCATLENGTKGKRFTVEASSYVLAMGGIETVRMLKLSGDLGNNEKDHLGRGFMVHPLLTHAAKVEFGADVPTDIRNFFREQQVRLNPPQEEGGEYEHVAMPLVNPELIFDYDVFNAWGILAASEKAIFENQIANFRIVLYFLSKNEAIVNLNFEQVANEDSRITLDESQLDPVFGQPVSHVDWKLKDEDKRTAKTALELTEAFLRKHGAVSYELMTDLSGGADNWHLDPEDPAALATGDHHMGALRMSAKPEDGIVNSNARMHTVNNLYIAGCSIFPTGGYANPTLTIVALSLKLADHLKTL